MGIVVKQQPQGRTVVTGFVEPPRLRDDTLLPERGQRQAGPQRLLAGNRGQITPRPFLGLPRQEPEAGHPG